MDIALIVAAALMGFAGAPHCAAMCGAACGALVRGDASVRPGAAWLGFLSGRVAGYAAAGAIASSAVALAGALGETASALHALWTLLHAAALALGLWLLITARQPAWMQRIGAAPAMLQPAGNGWQRVAGPLRSGGLGLAWVALPCGLLQSALVVAALSSYPAGGAAAMAAFALTSSLGLAVVPALTLRWGGVRVAALQSGAWVVRLAGAALAGASAWALGHGLWQRVVAFCTG